MKGLRIARCTDGKSFVLQFDAPGIPTADVKIRFIDAKTIQFKLDSNSTDLLQGSNILREGKKPTLFISKTARILHLPFCPLEANPNYAGNPFILHSDGAVFVKLTPTVETSNDVTPNQYGPLTDRSVL